MTESIGRQYETAIPALSDTANIQEAFRIYHYGVPTTEFNPTNTEPSDLEPKSIAFYLTDFQEQINDITSILSPTAYEKRGNLVVAGDDGPIVLELNPEYPTNFSENGLVLTSYDGADEGMRWQAPEITITNIENLFNKTLGNTTITSDGLKFKDSSSLHITTVTAPTQTSSKTVFLPTSAAVMPGASTTLVGTDTTQTLTNKTLTSALVSSGGAVVGTTATQTLTNKTLTSASVTSGGSVVGTTATQTLTNKTISLEPANNTITGILPVANGATPAGVISQYAGTNAPTGYLLCQGQSVSTTTFAALFAAIGYNYGGSGGSFNLPNLQNRVPVGRGSGTFGSLNATGGAETVALTTANMAAHTHSGTTAAETQEHIHSGSTGTVSADHVHSGTTEGGNSLHTHTGPNHAHSMVVIDERFAVTRSSGSLTTQSAALPFSKSTSLSGNQNTGSASNNHTHTFTTSGISANHTHGFDTGGRSATHNHTYTTDNGTGSGTAHNNLQPYIVVNYIIKT